MVFKNKQKQTSSKRKLYIIIAVILVLLGAGFLYVKQRENKPAPAQSPSTKLENKLSKEETDKKGAPETGTPSNTTKQSAGQTTPATTGSNVTPVITYFGVTGSQVEVDAFIPAIIENGGTCTLTVTNGSTVVARATKPAHSNAQSTNCENFLINSAGSSSSWRAVVSYTSSSHNGTSGSTPLQK